MLKWILFSLLSFNLFGLEISLAGAKENFQNYSTLHLKDTKPFLCQEVKNDFKIVIKIVCAFNEKPSSSIKNLQNSFFKIENKIKKKTFFLIITPFKKLKLYPMIFNMTKDDTVYQANVKLAPHWMIVGYNKELPFIKKEIPNDTSINFPFQLSVDNIPFVGGLDLKGNPVHIQRVGDVTEYLKIKKLYKEEKYDLCNELIDEIMEDYPNSLFMAELLFYKIQVYSKLEDNDNVIAMSKEFLREHSSDENIPEVLALVARGYSKIGLSTDADYFFDRLFSEHDSTESAKRGYIYKGEMLEESGAASKAVLYYKKALNETAQVKTAATAAYKLAYYRIKNGEKEKASSYIKKIVQAKPEFFMQDLATSLEMMYMFADNSAYKTAASIAKSIVDATNKEHDEYERLLKDRGMWLSKSDDKQLALSALNEYLKIFPDGVFEEKVWTAKDELFFDTNDGNFSEKLKKYNILIENYDNDTIGKRAIYEKAKLLLANDMFTDVLDMEESVLKLDAEFYEGKEDIIVDSAIGVMKTALKNRECEEVLSISKDYNITLSNDWDNGVYECSMMGGDFVLAKRITSRNLDAKDLELRKKWLYRHIKVDFATGNYSEVVQASQDLIALIEDSKEMYYKDVYRILFDTYQRLEKDSKLLSQIMEIEKIFGKDYKDIERYIAVMTMGERSKDDNVVIKYGEEVVKIQNSSSSYAQSPFVEFTLYQAYLNKEELDKALKIIESLNTLELKKEIRARQKYLLATILEKLWRGEEAAIAYQEAIDADAASAWADLAKSALENF
ncbi:MAG: flagellar protein [Sulfurimonas sp.]|nr:flagellar protein [Sulfurimonas sp.]